MNKKMNIRKELLAAAEDLREAVSISMPKRCLGRTGYDVSLFSLGGGGGIIEQREQKDKAVEIINKSIDMGVNYIDTAYNYGDGGSEKNIGEVMPERRDEVFLATKTDAKSYDKAMRQFETSLTRLQTDYIDLYQHHGLDDELLKSIFRKNGALKAFERLYDEGVVRHLGVTSHSSRILVKALERYDFDCVLVTLNQEGINMEDVDYLDDFFDITNRNDVGVIGMKVFGQDEIFKEGISAKQAFQYTLSQPIHTAVIGVTELGQVKENVELARDFKWKEV